MSDSYVCSGAVLRCTCGTSQAKLTVLPTRTVFLTGQPMANISDHLSFVNLGAFGRCRSLGFPATASATAAAHGKLTPMPCMHNTPFPWMGGKNDYIIKGDPALLKSSTCQCLWGGTISIVGDGQTDTGPADNSREEKETEEEMKARTEEKQQLDVDSVLDGIQLTLDIAGLAPGVGAIPDLLNASISALRGNWTEAGISLLAAVPGIGDAATATKFAQKGVKAAKNAKKAEKVANSANDNVVSLSKYKADKLQKAIDESDNVVRFPCDRVSDTALSKAKQVQKQDNILNIDRYEKKVEEQVNGANKVTVTKKTDTIIDSIGGVSGSSPNRGYGYTGPQSSGGRVQQVEAPTSIFDATSKRKQSQGEIVDIFKKKKGDK